MTFRIGPVLLLVLAACGSSDRDNHEVQPPPVQVDDRAMVRGLDCTGPDSSGWCWQAPQPGPQRLQALQFSNDRQGWAFGDTFVRTDDGGQTWVRPSPAGAWRNDLVDLVMDEQGRGWAWSADGSVIRTRDRGNSWQAATPLAQDPRTWASRRWLLPDGSLLLGPSGPDPWVLAGQSACDTDARALRNTADGGDWTTLQIRPMHVARPAPGVATLHGYAAGRCDRWGRSTDGGRSFEPASGVDADLRLLAIGDGGQGLWALVGRRRQDAIGPNDWPFDCWLLRSRDDGLTWGDPVALPADTRPAGLVLRDGVGLLAEIPALDDTGHPLLSLDGGRSWSRLAPPADAAGALLVGNRWLMQALPDASARVSNDLGRSWTRLPALPSSPTALIDQPDGSLAWSSEDGFLRRAAGAARTWTTVPYGPWPHAPVTGLVFFDALEGVASLRNSGTLHTTDGGRHWSAELPASAPLLTQLHRAADGTAWAIDSGALLRSADRGRSWQGWPLPVDVTGSGRLARVQMIDARSGWLRTQVTACSDLFQMQCTVVSSTVFVTDDGGGTWAARWSQVTGQQDRALAMAAGGLALRVTSDHRVLRSTNAGRDWSPVLSLGPERMLPNTAVVMMDERRWWLVDDARIWRSTDGGLTWQGTDTPLLKDGLRMRPTTIAFADALNGWAMSEARSELIATTDGGQTWAVQADGPASSMNVMAVVDARRVWLAGERGILATATGGR